MHLVMQNNLLGAAGLLSSYNSQLLCLGDMVAT